MQERDEWDLTPDGVGQALEHLMPRSAGRVVREAFYGSTRFEELLGRTGLTRSVLADQLERLVSSGVLQRIPYQVPGGRARHEYHLSARGRGLAVALVALLDWSQQWVTPPPGPTTMPVHTGCGAVVHATLHCEAGHTDVVVDQVHAVVGPGARRTGPHEQS